MQGHAGANIMPLVASNRVGREKIENSGKILENSALIKEEITFYGSSFIANQFGAKVKEANRKDECVLVEEFDLETISKLRVSWGVFRDRRPDLYSPLLSVTGTTSK